MSIVRRASVSLLAVLLLAGTAASARAQVSADREVVELGFDGNEAFSDSELARAILTRQTRCRTFLFRFPLPFCLLTNWGFAQVREYLDEDELPLDLLRLRLFYRQRGYRAAVVDTLVEREDGRARIRFRIEENEPTRIASLKVTTESATGDSVPMQDREVWPKLLRVTEGDPLDLVALGVGERAITDVLRREGWIDATVLREYYIPRDTKQAYVTLRVVPGVRVRIGEVTVEGAGSVGEPTIRELLTFQSGEWFDEERILESQRSLYNLEALRWASISTERRNDTDTLIDLRVKVATAPKQSLRTGAGVYTDECVQLRAEYFNRNFLGAARLLRVTGRLSNLFASELQGSFPCTDVSGLDVYQELNYLAQVGFEQPVFSHGRNTVRASVFTERATVPDLYVRTGSGGEITFSRRLTSKMLLALAYRPELTSFAKESADVYFCVNFGICTPEDIQVLTDARWLAPASLLWSYDRTNSPFAATRGFYVALELEEAAEATVSDYRYTRGTLDAAAFKELGNRGVLALHLRAGGIDPRAASAFGGAGTTESIVHPKKRFFAGGPQSVRGFGLNLLGPTVLVLDTDRCAEGQGLEECATGLPPGAFDERPEGGNAVFEGSIEGRLRLGGRWTAVGFVDFGQVWRDFRNRQDPIVATPGVGIRFLSPVGPLRLDVAFNPTDPSDKKVVALFPDGSIQELATRVRFDPFTYDDPGPAREFYRRLQLQFSIGEAF